MARKRSIASLSVSLTAKTAAFRKSMQRAMKSITKFAARIKAATVRVAKMGIALAAVATGGMAVFIKQSFASLDALAKFSDRLGINANALRSLERAAELSGASIQVFRKAMIMMSKNVAEAATGIGEAKDALEFLRLDATKLVKLKPDELFLRIVGAVEKIPNRVKAIGAMADIVGTRATALLNVVDLGVDQLRKMQIESERISGVLTRFDLAKIQQANDAVGNMFRSLRGIADRLATQIAPLVELLATKMTNRMVALRQQLTLTIQIGKMAIVRFLNFIDREVQILASGVLQTMSQVAKAFADSLAKMQGQTTRLLAMWSVLAKADPFATAAGKLNVLGGIAGRARGVAADLAARAQARVAGLAGRTIGGELLGDKLARSVGGAVERALAHFNAIQAEISKRAFRQFFEGRVGLRLFSTVAATAAAAAVSAATGSASRARSRLSRPLTGLQISPSRDFVPGIYASRNKAQLVQDPQLRQVIAILLEQSRLLQERFFGVTS